MEIWQDFPEYEKLLWKIVWKWVPYVRGKYEPRELFNELVVVYANSYNTWKTPEEMADWQGKSKGEFAKLLAKSCWSHMCDLIIRKNQKVIISIDDVILMAPSSEFDELFKSFFIESMNTLLTSDSGKFILDVIVNHLDKLEEAHCLRKATKKRQTKINKEDLRYYLTRVEGWKWQDYICGMKDVESAFRTVLAMS